MGIGAERLCQGTDIFCYYDHEHVFLRWEAATDRWFQRFEDWSEECEYDWARDEKGVMSVFLGDALRFGEEIDAHTYYNKQ